MIVRSTVIMKKKLLQSSKFYETISWYYCGLSTTMALILVIYIRIASHDAIEWLGCRSGILDFF